jgi:predicted O-methyltransferase YrrM
MLGREDLLAEMGIADHALLINSLKEKKPKKILELGVSAGGTTALLLENKEKDSILYSVDIKEWYYKDEAQKTGFIASSCYVPDIHGEWNTFWGKDVSECIDEIGGDIDFVVLDTAHALPGEFLSFLAVLPYLSEDSTLFLHDIALHLFYKQKIKELSMYRRHTYCNGLLFNAIRSSNKFLSDDDIPSAGLIFINKNEVKKHVFDILNMLCLDWKYYPEDCILHKTRSIIERNYLDKDLKIFDLAIRYNAFVHKK